jgi:N-acyl-phosphatidylethanolamine-hydrolysing phospholipase D
MSEVVVDVIPKPPTKKPPSHHVGKVGSPPSSFINPWPSAKSSFGYKIISTLQIRFHPKRKFVPVPVSRDELVQIRKPDWGSDQSGLKATWIGHATFLIETTATPGKSRGIRIFLDPVFSKRLSPVKFIGPKRFTPTPCKLNEVPEVDVVMISHNHYDHLEVPTIKRLYAKNPRIHFFCGLNLKKWFLKRGIPSSNVTELDWWDEASVRVPGVGHVKLACVPAQHNSARTLHDTGKALWCSWVIQEVPSSESTGKKLYFAGDTGYRTVNTKTETPEEWDTLPGCPAFAKIGERYGPFDLSLLPIGCYNPRHFLSSVHCSPTDSIRIHKDIRSKKSLGMHYGTLRGGISAHYEDVRLPPKDWRQACEAAGLEWGEEIMLCDIGETVVV